MQLQTINIISLWAKFTLMLLAISLLPACASQYPRAGVGGDDAAANAAGGDCQGSLSYAGFLAANRGNQHGDTIRVTVTGYGAPPKKYYPEYQRRLLAMRASRIDAYRALAETVGGIHVAGGTTVGEMVVQHDSYRAFVDSYITGANTVNVNERDDGSYETTLETVVDEQFYNALRAHHSMTACGGMSGRGSVAMQDKDSRANRFYYSE